MIFNFASNILFACWSEQNLLITLQLVAKWSRKAAKRRFDHSGFVVLCQRRSSLRMLSSAALCWLSSTSLLPVGRVSITWPQSLLSYQWTQQVFTAHELGVRKWSEFLTLTCLLDCPETTRLLRTRNLANYGLEPPDSRNLGSRPWHQIFYVSTSTYCTEGREITLFRWTPAFCARCGLATHGHSRLLLLVTSGSYFWSLRSMFAVGNGQDTTAYKCCQSTISVMRTQWRVSFYAQ